MANLQLSTGLRDDLLDDAAAFNDMFDGGILEIYSGSQPAEADDVPGAGTVLATITLPTPCFSAAVAGVISLSGTWEDTSADAGAPTTATWFRMKKSGDDDSDSTTWERIDGDISTTGAGTGDLQLDSTSITAGQAVTISTFTITMPAS